MFYNYFYYYNYYCISDNIIFIYVSIHLYPCFASIYPIFCLIMYLSIQLSIYLSNFYLSIHLGNSSAILRSVSCQSLSIFASKVQSNFKVIDEISSKIRSIMISSLQDKKQELSRDHNHHHSGYLTLLSSFLVVISDDTSDDVKSLITTVSSSS